jgi:hypothetical protein
MHKFHPKLQTGNQLNEDKLGGESSAFGTKGNVYRILVGKREERDHLAYLGIEGR